MSDIERELVERSIDDDLRTAAVLKQGAGRMRQGAAEIAQLQDRIESNAKVIAGLRGLLEEASLMLGTSEDEWDRTMARRMREACGEANEQTAGESK
jgi:hypothetical protein